MGRTGWGTGIGLAAWLTAGLAAAQPAPAPNPEAVRYYQSGLAAFRAGQFTQAITLFKAADGLSPSPSLSYDIAECYEKLADLRNARSYYEEYLRRAPKAEDRSKVEAELASIDAQIVESEKKSQPSAPLVVTEEVAAPAPPNRLASYILMGIGAASLGVGIGLDVAANGAANSLVDALTPQGSKAQGYYDQANGLWTGAIVGYLVGGAALATGAVIFLVQSVGHSGPAVPDDMP